MLLAFFRYKNTFSISLCIKLNFTIGCLTWELCDSFLIVWDLREHFFQKCVESIESPIRAENFRMGLSLILILIWRLITKGEQLSLNLDIKKKSVSSINSDIHHSKVSSSEQITKQSYIPWEFQGVKCHVF